MLPLQKLSSALLSGLQVVTMLMIPSTLPLAVLLNFPKPSGTYPPEKTKL